MRGYLKGLLNLAPAPVVDWAKKAYDFVPPSLKYGKPYREALALIEESEWWDEKSMREYQARLLRRLMAHCYESVPYYRKLFHETGLKPYDIDGPEDLAKFPFLDKQIVRERKSDLLSETIPSRRLEPEVTSGSTGAPLDFHIDLATRAMERALALRQLFWLGYQQGDVIAEIKEDSFANPERVFYYYPASRQLRFAFFNVDDRKLAAMADALERYKPAFIKAFPSSLYIISRWMERNKRSVPPVKYVVTSSENLYPSIKDQAERVFNARVIDHYGQNEQVAYAFQCAEGNGYHVQIEQCILELIPAGDGKWEIVGTSLHNLGMPFVRYRIGDLAVKGEGTCPCGRKHPLLAGIIGRDGDVIVTPERNIVAPVAMDYAFYHLEEIKEGQIIQEDISTLRVKIVPWETFSDTTRHVLLARLESYLQSPTMNVIIEEAEEIPRTKRGKKPFLISRIKIDQYI
jgi:phenylacetate-CoA ligase